MGTPKINVELILEGEKEYKRAIASINSEQRTLRSEMALATEKFHDQQNSIEALTEQQKLLKRQYEIQEQKVKKCSEEVGNFAAAHVQAASEKYGGAEKRCSRLGEDSVTELAERSDENGILISEGLQQHRNRSGQQVYCTGFRLVPTVRRRMLKL